MKTSTALIVVAAAAAGLWLIGKQQEAALAAQLAAAPQGSALSRVVDDVVTGIIDETGNPFGTTDWCPKDQKTAGTCDQWGAKRLGELADLVVERQCGGAYPGFECIGYSVEQAEIRKKYPGAEKLYEAKRAAGAVRAQKAGAIVGGLLSKWSPA